MSEDEIYNYLISFISSKIKQNKLDLRDMAGFNLGFLLTEDLQKAVQGLMDLRKAEKEKNNKYLEYQCKKCSNNKICKENQWCVTMDRIPCICDNFQDTKSVSKDKIKEHIDLVREEKEHYIDLIDDYNAQICDEIIEALQNLLEE